MSLILKISFALVVLTTVACTDRVLSIGALNNFSPVEPPSSTTPTPTDKVSLQYASTQSTPDQYNTVRNNATADDAHLYMKAADFRLYESGKTLLTVKLQSLTQSTVHDLEIIDLDLGNLNSSDWTLSMLNGERLYVPKMVRYDVSADGQVRQLEFQLRLFYNDTQQKYVGFEVGAVMLGTDYEGNQGYGIGFQ